MVVSSLVNEIREIYKTPEYADRIPEYVRTAIENGTFGSQDFPADIENEVFQILLNKIAKQDIYAFKYNGFDGEKYNKGYLPYGAIIEDDYIDIMNPDTVNEYPKQTPEGNLDPAYEFGKYDPFKINYPVVKVAYYMTRYFLQYHVTTIYDLFKRAFISEGAAVEFVARIKGVLPESAKLDKYLIFRNMITLPTDYSNISPPEMIYKKENVVEVPVAGDTFTAQESINAVRRIRDYVTAMKYPTTRYNKMGVTNSAESSDLVLFISEGIYNALKSAQYNAYHEDLDLGCEIQFIDGFGTNAETTGQFACLLDKRGFKLYTTYADKMEGIYNPYGEGYWNTYYKCGGLIGYSLHRNAVAFVLTNSILAQPGDSTITDSEMTEVM